MFARILQGAGWVFFGIVMGRLLGFAREILISRSLGVTSSADIAVLILTVPNLLLDLLVGGALGAALVPAFVRAQVSGEDRRLQRRITLIAAACSVVLALTLAAASPWLILLLAPGLDAHVRADCARLVSISLLSIPFTALSAVAQAFLHARGRFRVASFGTPIYNVCLVAPLLVIGADDMLIWLPVLVVAGACLRYLVLVWAMAAAGPVPTAGAIAEQVPLLRRYMQALVAGSVVLLLPVVARGFASVVGDGSIAVINYASKLIDLPLGSCLTVLSVVLLPQFSKLFAADGGMDRVRALLHRSVGITLTLAVPMTVGIVCFADHLAELVFHGGQMGTDEIAAIAAVVQQLAFGLPAMALVALTQAALNAKGDMVSPLRASVLGLLGLLAGGVVAVGGGELAPIAWGWSAASWLVLIGHVLALRRHGLHIGGVLLAPSSLGVCAATIVVMVAARWLADDHQAGLVQGLVFMSMAGLVSAGIAAWSFAIFSRSSTEESVP